ncbi:MAG TPA: L,D-transpeptidase [Methylovirgula sp.]|nr:L,D-transpeptidase [Methylovirgula sp.]
MVNSRLVGACIVGAFVSSFSVPSFADPMVVRGLYPRGGAAAGQTYNTPDAQQPNEAAYAAPAYGAPVQAAPPASSSDSLGGGLLEMIVRGGQSQSSLSQPVYASPSHARDMTALATGPAAAGAVAPDPRAQRTIDPMYMRQEVDYTGGQKPGTIVIDTPHKFLYLVEKDGKAMRYGIGVGRPGFMWSGVKTITRKAEWPDWTPPSDMLKRRPDLPTHMAGGPENPLGARAMYLGSSLYRIHGTNEPYTIGTNVSSGCIRLMNQDVEDLYNRVKVGTKVVVM